MNQKAKSKTAPQQTILSLIILAVLAVISGSVFWTQFNYNPAVQQVKPAATEGEKNLPEVPDSVTEPIISPPPGQSPLSPPEAFDAATLSDKINGKAELYLSAGFVRLTCQRFKGRSAGEVWMEVFVYDMGSTRNAFSVFSAQRREDARTLALAQYAYQTPNALFFVHGPFYVEIVASDVSEAVIAPMTALAEAFIAAHPMQAQAIGEKELFPEAGLVQNSISLVAADAFGYDRFDQIFTAVYQLRGSELMAYYSRRKTPREAQELASSYRDFLTAFGGRAVEAELGIKTGSMIDILDTYEIVFSHGAYVAGVREAADRQAAQELAVELFNRIKAVTGE